MSKSCTLNAGSLFIELSPKVYEEDIHLPVNCTLHAIVKCGDFSASADMDIDIKAFRRFASELSVIHETLCGSASIRESYGDGCLNFSGDGRGHIGVSGCLFSRDANGFECELKFESSIDQTELRTFVSELLKAREADQ